MDVHLLDCNIVWTTVLKEPTLSIFRAEVLKIVSVGSSETLVSTHRSTRPYNPEDQRRHLH
jgi:hypothetical protein